MSYFQDLRVYRSQKPWGKSLKELRACRFEWQDRDRPLPPSYSERKPLNLEKTTSSVLSVLLSISGFRKSWIPKLNNKFYLEELTWLSIIVETAESRRQTEYRTLEYREYRGYRIYKI